MFFETWLDKNKKMDFKVMEGKKGDETWIEHVMGMKDKDLR